MSLLVLFDNLSENLNIGDKAILNFNLELLKEYFCILVERSFSIVKSKNTSESSTPAKYIEAANQINLLAQKSGSKNLIDPANIELFVTKLAYEIIKRK